MDRGHVTDISLDIVFGNDLDCLLVTKVDQSGMSDDDGCSHISSSLVTCGTTYDSGGTIKSVSSIIPRSSLDDSGFDPIRVGGDET